MKRLLVIDTCMLCCWLKVPGKDSAGPVGDTWNYDRIDKLLKREIGIGTGLVLPLASIIETGNHIAQAAERRFECATALAAQMRLSAEAKSPWVSFTEQAELWANDQLARIASQWPELAARKLSMGDVTILEVAEYYARTSYYEVEILTADAGLKAYQPSHPAPTPRRRS